MNEDIANAMGGSSPQGGGNIAMPERLLGFNANKGRKLRDILMRKPPSVKGDLAKKAIQNKRDKGL